MDYFDQMVEYSIIQKNSSVLSEKSYLAGLADGFNKNIEAMKSCKDIEAENYTNGLFMGVTLSEDEYNEEVERIQGIIKEKQDINRRSLKHLAFGKGYGINNFSH